jgi:beta-glucanase (GH16 family)
MGVNGGSGMKKKLFLAVTAWLVLASIPVAAQSKHTLAPDQIPGAAVYIPYPVKITLDGDLSDWKGVPIQRVETGLPKGPDKRQNQYFDFAVAADNDYLYIYMYSEDNNIIAGKHKGDFWNEDSMEFYINLTDNLNARAYGPGIAQITINATNIGNKSVSTLSVSGTNAESFKVKAKVFKTADGWAFEAAVPLDEKSRPAHGKTIGFQVHANGASSKDRDSKLIWGKLDTADQSYQNPGVFGRAVFFKIGSTDIPVPSNLGSDMGQTFTKEGAVGKSGRKLVWSDEFDYEGAPDQKKWAYDAPDAGKWNEELQVYTSLRANSLVKDGFLIISAIKDKAGKWTSARLFTKNRADWTYGYFEIRAKLPPGKGTWPAIWMMPSRDTYGSWPDSGEIDIMEFVGFEPDKIHTSAHTKKFNHRIKTQQTRAAFIQGVCSDFHTYAVEWSPKGLFWYVDDKPFYYFLNENKGSGEWPFDKPFFIILNVAMGGIWGGMNGMDPKMDRADMVIDYVRVYQ